MKGTLLFFGLVVLASSVFGQAGGNVARSIGEIDFKTLMRGATDGIPTTFEPIRVVKKFSSQLMLIDHSLAPLRAPLGLNDLVAGRESHPSDATTQALANRNQSGFQAVSAEFDKIRPDVRPGKDYRLRLETPFLIYRDYQFQLIRSGGNHGLFSKPKGVDFLTKVPLGLSEGALEQLTNDKVPVFNNRGDLLTRVEITPITVTGFQDTRTLQGVLGHYVDPSWDLLGLMFFGDYAQFAFFGIADFLSTVSESEVNSGLKLLSLSISPDELAIIEKAKASGMTLYLDISPFGKMVLPLEQTQAYIEAKIRDDASYASVVYSRVNGSPEETDFLNQVSNGSFGIAAKAIQQAKEAAAAAEATAAAEEAAKHTPEAIDAALKVAVLGAVDDWQEAMKNYSEEYDAFVKGQKTEVRSDYETKQEFADRQKEELKDKKGEEPVFSTVEVQVPLKVTAGKFSPQSKSWPLSFSSVNDWFPISGSEEWKADLSDLKTSYADGESLIAERGLSGVATVLVSRDSDRWLLTRTDVEIDSTRDSSSLVEDDSVFTAPFSVKDENVVPGKWTRQKKVTVSPTPAVVPTKDEVVATTAKKKVGSTAQGQTYERFETSGFASKWTLSTQYSSQPFVKLVGTFGGFDGSDTMIINGNLCWPRVFGPPT